MHNSLAPRSPATRRRIYRERQAAKETDRASGIRLDLYVQLLAMYPTKEVVK